MTLWRFYQIRCDSILAAKHSADEDVKWYWLETLSDLQKYSRASCIHRYGHAADFFYIWLYTRINLFNSMYNINQVLHDGRHHWCMDCYPFRSTWVHPVFCWVHAAQSFVLRFTSSWYPSDILISLWLISLWYLDIPLISSHFTYKILSLWTDVHTLTNK